MNLDKQIEAVLFFKGEPIAVKKLSQILDVSVKDIDGALKTLGERLKESGIRLLQKEDKMMLGTASEMGTLIESLLKEDLNKDLGKAGLETLTIVLYKGPITRSGVDYIRGVNSAFILRNLLVRGLVEKETNPEDQRSFIYRPTFELLSYLGITDVKDLPEYKLSNEKIDKFIKEQVDESDEFSESENFKKNEI